VPSVHSYIVYFDNEFIRFCTHFYFTYLALLILVYFVIDSYSGQIQIQVDFFIIIISITYLLMDLSWPNSGTKPEDTENMK